MRYSLAIAGALLSTIVNAHMYIVKPMPFRLAANPHTKTTDYDIRSPLNKDGSNFPCKGYHLDPAAEVAAVEEWAAGSEQSFTMNTGSAFHGGGSCQASISEDNGATFKVVKSFIGNCPTDGGNFKFTVPKETKTGRVLFAWTWVNKIGQREMYMNCAAITITGGGAGLSALPEIFKANIGTKSPGCITEEGVDTKFPNPGPDVVTAPLANVKLPPGDCGPAAVVSATALGDQAPTPTPVVPAVSAPPPATLPSNTPVQSNSAAVEGCMCSCGGPNGYVVNIMPAGPVLSMIQNTTSTVAVAATSSPLSKKSLYRFQR